MNADARKELIESFLTEIAAFRTQFDVFRFLKRVCDLFSFNAFMVFQLPEPSDTRISDRSVITNWPTPFLSAYDRLGLLRTSPVIARLRRSTKPFAMTLMERLAAIRDGDRSEVEHLFRSFRLTTHVMLPVHDAAGTRGAVGFAGDREAPCYGEMLELSLLGIHVYERLSEIAYTAPQDASTLTERETDCLTWTAEGKTSSEIAAILGLSEHTVNHYLNRAAKKLSTVNRTQAVAKALRRGWIR